MPSKTKPKLASTLASRVIALPESRQLDVLAGLFERRQATVLRVPLVAILDRPDQAPIKAWLEAFIRTPPDLFIVLTGEGLRRLRGAAQRAGLEEAFIKALARVHTLTRGPKPGRALKEMGLQADELAESPTTPGVIASLQARSLAGKRLAVQLYGDDPNTLLMDYLASCDLADCQVVAPYIYADDSEAAKVLELIYALAAGEVDMMAFTSKPQIHRLLSVARKHGLQDELQKGLARVLIAAVGPVVAEELEKAGVRVAVMPASSFFMKPLVTAAEQAFANTE